MSYKDSAQQKQYYELYRTKQENKDAQWRSQLRIVHSITPEEYVEMLAVQEGCCAICEEPPSGKRLCVDHDHRCCPGVRHCKNCIRGLLCEKCNRAIGLLNDDSELFIRAKKYVEK